MDEIRAPGASRDSVAYRYAGALLSEDASSDAWPEANHAIVGRWSISALGYIKKKAWDMVAP